MEDLKDLNSTELKEIAKKEGVSGYGGMSKDSLIENILKLRENKSEIKVEDSLTIKINGSYWSNALNKTIYKGVYTAKTKEELEKIKKEAGNK